MSSAYRARTTARWSPLYETPYGMFGKKITRMLLSEAQNHRCCYCGVIVIEPIEESERRGKTVPTNTASLEHLQPLSDDGENVWANLVVACVRCNSWRQQDVHAIVHYYFVQEVIENNLALGRGAINRRANVKATISKIKRDPEKHAAEVAERERAWDAQFAEYKKTAGNYMKRMRRAAAAAHAVKKTRTKPKVDLVAGRDGKFQWKRRNRAAYDPVAMGLEGAATFTLAEVWPTEGSSFAGADATDAKEQSAPVT